MEKCYKKLWCEKGAQSTLHAIKYDFNKVLAYFILAALNTAINIIYSSLKLDKIQHVPQKCIAV